MSAKAGSGLAVRGEHGVTSDGPARASTCRGSAAQLHGVAAHAKMEDAVALDNERLVS